MKITRLLAGVLACIAMLFAFAPTASAAPPDRSEVPLTGTSLDTGSLVDAGSLDITDIGLNDAGQLVISGVISDVTGAVLGTITDVVVGTMAAGEQARCDILFLDLAGLDLDLLGLNVVLDQVILDVFAEPGPGNLLGNLLCAVTGLLDGGGPLTAVNNLLDRITRLLG
jgi:hypothetical protein